jgi:hypothetical protein
MPMVPPPSGPTAGTSSPHGSSSLGPDGGDQLAGGEVERGHANKRQGSSIGLTRDRLVAVDRPGESPASGGAPVGNWTVVREM